MSRSYGAVLKKTGLFVYFHVTGCLRKIKPRLGLFPFGFYDVRLQSDAVFSAELSEPRKQISRDRGRKAGCQNRFRKAVRTVFF